MRPEVTVILPTFNRAAFLPDALASILAQTFTGWRLVVVDDGSTDDTKALVSSFAASCPQTVKYVYRANGGAYAARNTGLDHADADYVAFFDSDDTWLPHHLERCARALRENPDVDWVYGSCQVVDSSSGRTLEPNTFFVRGRPRPFLRLKTRSSAGLHVIVDPNALEGQLLGGLYAGLQNSVIRREVFARHRFDPRSKVVDDQMFVVRALAEARRFAYFLEPHVLYRVHDDNSSGSATTSGSAKHIQIFREMVSGLEQLRSDLSLTPRQRRALAKRLGREYFWHLGYLGLWKAHREAEALEIFRRSLSVWPWNLSRWKTYLLARARVAFRELVAARS